MRLNSVPSLGPRHHLAPFCLRLRFTTKRLGGSNHVAGFELELELIQTHMTQKPVLRVEVGARALRVLIKKMRLDGKGKCGCARHSCVGVDLWRASQGGMGM